MTQVTLSGWRPGLRKISLAELFRTECGHSLSAAKQAVGAILENHALKLSFDERAHAEAFLAEATRPGAAGIVHAAGP